MIVRRRLTQTSEVRVVTATIGKQVAAIKRVRKRNKQKSHSLKYNSLQYFTKNVFLKKKKVIYVIFWSCQYESHSYNTDFFCQLFFFDICMDFNFSSLWKVKPKWCPFRPFKDTPLSSPQLVLDEPQSCQTGCCEGKDLPRTKWKEACLICLGACQIISYDRNRRPRRSRSSRTCSSLSEIRKTRGEKNPERDVWICLGN